MTLGILKARLRSAGVACLDKLPKNATHSFKLRVIVVETEQARFIDGELDLWATPLPDTVYSAKQAWVGMREVAERYIITVYTQ